VKTDFPRRRFFVSKILAVLRCNGSQCCPTVLHDAKAVPGREIIITDDFGSSVQMSLDNLAELVRQAKAGHLNVS
jgi:hypothetical protein